MISFFWDSIVESIGDDGLPIYDRACTAQDLRNLFGKFFTDGVYIGDPNAFQVTAGTGMTVNVKQGFGAVKNTCCLEVNERTLEIVAAGDKPRIDTVVLRWDSNLEARKVDLYVRQGSLANNPVRPNLTRTESVHELGIADIYIPANSTSISGERITDTRLEDARCGIMSPFMEIDTTTFYAQLQAALDSQTAELQKQTDKAVELAQNALNETEAGNLQNQIDTIESNLPYENYSEYFEDLSEDTPAYWAALGTGQGQMQYQSFKVLGKDQNGYIIYGGRFQSFMSNGKLVQFLEGSGTGYTDENGAFHEASNIMFMRTANIMNNVVSRWDGDASHNGWERVATPAPGSITEDMLSEGSVTANALKYEVYNSVFEDILSENFTVTSARLAKLGGTCMAYCHIKAKEAISAGDNIGTMPDGLRPIATTIFTAYNPVGASEVLRISSNGTVTAGGNFAANKNVYLCCTYAAI